MHANFGNVSRWTPAPNGDVRIEHLRHGETRPVRLVDLFTLDGSSWTTRAPHICGRDQYTATATVSAEGVRVRWRICGPGKAMIVETRYAADDGAGDRNRPVRNALKT
jgi:Family of unknown function (DUF6314)